MLLGKRPRPPMKRTTSMTEITFDLSTNDEMMSSQPSDPQKPFKVDSRQQNERLLAHPHNNNNSNYNYMNMISPRNHRRNSPDFVETSHFLRSCSLCRRRLVPNRDIYMYRGDSAFCSPECRQQQMSQDEGMEKCSLASKKLDQVASTSASAARSQVTAKGETVAAL